MVKYETILKVIEYDIKKCNSHFLLPSKVKGVFNRFHKETCGENPSEDEYMVATDDKGNVIYTMPEDDEEPQDSRVSLGLYEAKEHLFKTGEAVHITHNHPSGGWAICFSDDDVSALFQEEDGTAFPVKDGKTMPIRSISAESPNGCRLTLVRSDEFVRRGSMKKVNGLRDDLWMCYHHYLSNCISNQRTIFDEIRRGNGSKDLNDFKSLKELNDYINTETYKRVGPYEQFSEFKECKSGFRDLGLRLEFTHPSKFNSDEEYVYSENMLKDTISEERFSQLDWADI